MPVDLGGHTIDPVPVLYVGPNISRDPGTTFGERVAGQDGLVRFSGRALPMLLGDHNGAMKFGSWNDPDGFDLEGSIANPRAFVLIPV